MAFTDLNSEDRLVQQTFAEHLERKLGWESAYARNEETFGPEGKLGRRDLYDSLCGLIAERARWTEWEQTQAKVETLILDHVIMLLPTPPFTDVEKQILAELVYLHVWSQSESGRFGASA